MFKKTIISEFFTTVSFSQMMQSLYLIFFRPFSLKNWKEKELFEKKLLNYINSFSLGEKDSWKADRGQKIISFYNWRSAIFHALKMIWLTSEDEVIVNAYNCVSVSNAVIKSKAKIIYSDIEKETLGLDFEVLKKNISKNTKVIILQHTFWKKARDSDKIIDFARKNNILVIEDCAHSLGLNLLQSREARCEVWDFQIYSTWRDKVISSVTWGFLVINNQKFFYKIDDVKKKINMPSIWLILKNLNYNIVWYKAYKTYDFFKLWKIIIFLSRKLKLITEILTPNEKACNFDNFYLDYPNALAYLALKELEKLDKYTEIRLKNIKHYLENINNNKIQILSLLSKEKAEVRTKDYNWFRFPILLNSEEEKNRLINLGRKNNIIFWTSWSWINIAPVWTDLEKAQYKIWSCPVAEDISKRILTIPNHKMITKKDMDRVVDLLNKF
jgi:dTDP-4-amino-4,6-dideoxygalactose transaminase